MSPRQFGCNKSDFHAPGVQVFAHAVRNKRYSRNFWERFRNIIGSVNLTVPVVSLMSGQCMPAST